MTTAPCLLGVPLRKGETGPTLTFTVYRKSRELQKTARGIRRSPSGVAFTGGSTVRWKMTAIRREIYLPRSHRTPTELTMAHSTEDRVTRERDVLNKPNSFYISPRRILSRP